MSSWLIIADLLLAAGFTARLTRVIVTDDIGKWWIRDPLSKWARGKEPEVQHNAVYRNGEWVAEDPSWRKYLDGLACPYCVGFWIGVLILASLAAVGGPGDAAVWWRYLAGAFTMNYLTAHIGARLGDVADDD